MTPAVFSPCLIWQFWESLREHSACTRQALLLYCSKRFFASFKVNVVLLCAMGVCLCTSSYFQKRKNNQITFRYAAVALTDLSFFQHNRNLRAIVLSFFVERSMPCIVRRNKDSRACFIWRAYLTIASYVQLQSFYSEMLKLNILDMYLYI